MLTTEPVKEKAFLHSGEIAWQQAGDGITRKILSYDDQLMLVCVRFEKGAIGMPHNHHHRQVCYVESGRFEVTINGDTKTLQQGDSFFVAPGLMHGVVALESGSLIDVFSPAREDFIL